MVLCPEQMTVGLAEALMVGVLVMEMEIVCVPTQPALSPVTVYVVSPDGATLTVEVVALPALALHVYDVAPLALNKVL